MSNIRAIDNQNSKNRWDEFSEHAAAEIEEFAKEKGCIAFGIVAVAPEGGWKTWISCNGGIAQLALRGVIGCWLKELQDAQNALIEHPNPD